MSELGPVVVRRTIPASQASVWESLIEASLRTGWWQDTEIEPEVGGSVRSAGLEGKVDVLVNELTLGFRWSAPEDASERTVVIMLRPDDDDFDQTRVTVIESGFAALPNAAELVREAASGWESRFESLEQAVQGDIDADDAEGHEPNTVEALDAADPEPVSDVLVEVEDVELDDDEAVDDAIVDVEEVDVEPVDVEPVDVEPVMAEEDEVEAVEVEATEVEADEVVADDIVIDALAGERNIIEIVTDEVIEAEPIDNDSAIYLPEVSGAPYTESVVQITADLGVDEPVEVDETSEWERLLRGETLDED